MRGYQAFTLGDWLGAEEKIARLAFNSWFADLSTTQKSYIKKQIELKKNRGYFSEWLTENLVLGMERKRSITYHVDPRNVRGETI